MKKLRICFLAVLFLISFLNSAIAGIYSLHVEWGYTPPSAPAVKGFKLYQDGVAVIEWSGGTITAGNVVCTLNSQITNFTLTATFVDGTESPHSSPFAFDWANTRPAIPKDFKMISYLKPGVREKVLFATAVLSAG